MQIVRDVIESQDRPPITFVEGPPTLNGAPHAGHLRGRIIKDLWYRYMTLCGNKVAFQGGWDTQGLPVELQAEKELGMEGSKADIIQKAGIKRLVDACKGIVKKYNIQWEAVDTLMGMSMDHTKSYWTFTDRYIEREWHVLQKAQERGILEDDYTVIGYCPDCQTSLSHAEVNQRYDTIQDPSIYYKVKIQNENLYLVVWTTMPFTLVTDAMVGLHPDTKYAIVQVDDERWVVAADRLDEFMKEVGISTYVTQSIVRGSEMEGKRYIHPLLHKIPALAALSKHDTYHMAVAEPFVDASAGSGLVHIAPANGEEDMAVAKRRGITVFCPINDRVHFTADAGEYAGVFVRDTDDTIIDDLRGMGALIKAGHINHKYPLCWRSGHPIVWLARRGWFYRLERLGDITIQAAKSVRYYYDSPKNRFLAIVGERHPWCISRERYWGCPLPVWHCNDCGHKTWCFERAHIIEKAVSLPDGDTFELHSPWIDAIKVRCDMCGGGNTTREPYVLDTWHNSGAAPYASNTDDTYRSGIPAPFLTEGIDQTRGWAYTLLVENVILEGTAPYGSFLFQGHVLDGKGGKMSKSLGNVIDAQSLLERHPADLVRLYFMWKGSPVETLSFDEEEMRTRPYQILNTIYNLHLYYMQNTSYDRYDTTHDVSWAIQSGLLHQLDRWLLSRMQHTIGVVTSKMEQCRFHEAARAIDDFVIGALSQTYIQGVRQQLWEDDTSGKERRDAIYGVISAALRCTYVMLHPFCPFITEHLYHTAFGDVPSILLQKWPVPDDTLYDGTIEQAFEAASDILSVAAAARARSRLKRRWPLQRAVVAVPAGKSDVDILWGYIKDRMNVDELEGPHVMYHTGGRAHIQEMVRMGMPIMPVVRLNHKTLGPRIKGDMAAISKSFEDADMGIILDEGTFTFGEHTITEEDMIFEMEPADGYGVSYRDGYMVMVSTYRDEVAISRGFLRDVARHIQNLRRESGYDPTDILDGVHVMGLPDGPRHLVQSGGFDLAGTVRTKEILLDDIESIPYKDVDIDGQSVRLAIV